MTEREQFIQDIISVAIDGGINYWAKVRAGELPGTYAITEKEGGYISDTEGKGLTYALIPTTIELGFLKLQERSFEINAELRGILLAANVEVDATDIDVEGADVLVQAGLFGRIIYG